MSRIAKKDIYNTIDLVAGELKSIGGADGRIAKKDVKGYVKANKGQETKLPSLVPTVERFAKFADHRDAKRGATLTGTDIDRTAAYAKKELVGDYDKNNNGLSKKERAEMSTLGNQFIELTRELKALDKKAGAAKMA